ncbi:hypothetical protein Bca52824_052878 [Brassica carinata]|uniref:H15 domain-containing protein n=1 Tax=Brassica carinata TaxID=52824 RepID=A0A8X7R806_BRACI|nr:hypothetical protein Bca52824_052878 [Brassica carinata]
MLTNSSSSSPATSLPRSASSDFSVDIFVVDTKNAPRYDGMIFEALSALADANGSDVGSIFSFIEPRHEVPPNFRSVLSSRLLRRLAAQANFQRNNNKNTCSKTKRDKIKLGQTNNPTPSVSQEMIDEAAITAACKVVVVENKIHVAKVAVEELENTTKLAEETDLLLELAKDMYEQFSLDDKTRDFEDFLLMASSTHTTRQGRVSLGFSC